MNQSEISEEMLALIQSAKQGNAAAQNNLGWMYQHNEGNIHEAHVWYRRSAEQGYSHAQNNIGAIYQNGLGVEQDDSEAVR
ncbi:TPA: sel1 repeat family protein [Aeromonas hydrophila]|nr:sel1 repeat family protein [Aeromonas hydrophila]